MNGLPATLLKPSHRYFICVRHILCNPEDSNIPSLEETAFLHFFMWCWEGAAKEHITYTHTQEKPRNRMLTHRERQYQEMETEAKSIPGMHRSEPTYHLYCLSYSYLSWVSVACNQKNSNIQTQDFHLPHRQYCSFKGGQSGIMQRRILEQCLCDCHPLEHNPIYISYM